jgi:AcrR family transcriptional regulator
VPHAEGTVAARIQAALEQAAAKNATGAAEQMTVAALCRRVGISRNTLYRYYPEALEKIRQLRCRPDAKAVDQPTIERLRTQISSANTLTRQLVALLDHYVAAYQETRDLLAQRDRELAEERRSRGAMPRALRRRGDGPADRAS